MSKFPARMFQFAAYFGVLELVPLYFAPWPAHAPEMYLGFVGVALVFQAVFWVIGSNPPHYRALMPLAVAEKVAFGVPALALVARGLTAPTITLPATLDLLLGVGFFWAWRITPKAVT